nr:PBSX family phage terminase large subunit [uncultured Cellulosilyticum sp.]
MDYSKRYEVYYGSAGSGKSFFVAQKLVIKGIRSKRKILVIRKVGNTSKDSTFQLVKDTLQQFKIYDQCNVNKTDLTIELPNGTIFLFKGLDDPEKIKSIAGITDIWCEEATELTLDDTTQLNLRLRAKAENLQMFFSFNPTSKDNWVYTYFGFDKGIVPDNTMVLKTTYKDNRFLPDDYVQALLKLADTNPTYYKIYVEGDFATLDKLIYKYKVLEFNIEETIRDKNQCRGLDFGFTNDPTALSVFAVDLDNRIIWIYDEIYETELKNKDIASKITMKGYARDIIVADCQEGKSIAELKDLGIRKIKKSWKGQGSLLQGIQYLQTFTIYVHPRCKGHISELNNYTWKKNKAGDYINEPIDKYNHLMDAMRYGIQKVRKGRIKNTKRDIFGLGL